MTSGGCDLTVIELVCALARGEPVEPAAARGALIAATQAGPELAAWRERQTRRRLRDAALVDAARALGWPDDCGTWTAALRLERAVKRFEACHWPRLVAGVRMDLSPSADAIARAFLAGAQVPRSARGLFDVLRNSEQDIADARGDHCPSST